MLTVISTLCNALMVIGASVFVVTLICCAHKYLTQHQQGQSVGAHPLLWIGLGLCSFALVTLYLKWWHTFFFFIGLGTMLLLQHFNKLADAYQWLGVYPTQTMLCFVLLMMLLVFIHNWSGWWYFIFIPTTIALIITLCEGWGEVKKISTTWLFQKGNVSCCIWLTITSLLLFTALSKPFFHNGRIGTSEISIGFLFVFSLIGLGIWCLVTLWGKITGKP